MPRQVSRVTDRSSNGGSPWAAPSPRDRETETYVDHEEVAVLSVQASGPRSEVTSPTDDGFNMTRGRMNLPGVKGSAAAISLGPASRSGPTFSRRF